MQILLDDMPCDVEAATIGQAIDAAKSVAGDRGRLIVEVTVDGSRWSQSELDSPASLLGSAREVRLTTAEPGTLVRGIFKDAAEALADADTLQQQAAELLQSGDMVVALDKLVTAIAIWQTVQQAVVKGARAAGIDLDGISSEQGTIAAAIDQLNDKLGVVSRSLEQRDPIGLADTLLYEFPEVVRRWRSIMQALELASS